MPMYLTQGLHRAVQRHPQQIATICGSRQHSYSQYADRVARLAGALQTLGMGKGDRVGMLGLNSDRYLEFFFGTWWGGGAVNPVNIRWSAAEIAYSLDDCDTRILLVDEQFKAVATDLRSRSKALQTVVYIGDGDTPDGMLNIDGVRSLFLQIGGHQRSVEGCKEAQVPDPSVSHFTIKMILKNFYQRSQKHK
jgi:long-chain acyl-CoA synthetase